MPGTLAYILAEFPSLSETFIRREMNDLVERGLPLRIYALRAGNYPFPAADTLAERVCYRPRPGSGARRTALRRYRPQLAGLLREMICESGGQPRRLRERLVALDAALAFAPALAAGETRHLHAHFAGVPADLARYAARLLGITFSFSAHARDIYVVGRQDRAGLSANLREAAFAVTCTEYNRQYLLREFAEVSSEKVQRIYHGLPLEQFSERPPRADGPFHFLSVARLQPKKGLHVLLDACALLKEQGEAFTLTLVGDGPERERLAARARERGILDQVTFCGALPQAEVLPLYARADLFVLPCLIAPDGDRDGLPNVILEALASGLPVVSTPVSAIPEVIADGETGLLAPPGDAAALAAALSRLIADPALCRRLGMSGRDRVRRDFDLRNSPLAALFLPELQS